MKCAMADSVGFAELRSELAQIITTPPNMEAGFISSLKSLKPQSHSILMSTSARRPPRMLTRASKSAPSELSWMVTSPAYMRTYSCADMCVLIFATVEDIHR